MNRPTLQDLTELQSSKIAFDAYTLVDDLVFRALKMSLPNDIRHIVIDRINIDYMTDIGMISFLRREYISTRSLDHVCRIYWRSRREVGSPRVESILSQILLNVTASLIYDGLKTLYVNKEEITEWIQNRGISYEMIVIGSLHLQELIRDTLIMLRIFSIKENGSEGQESIQEVIKATLSGEAIENALKSIMIPPSFLNLDKIIQSITYAARGILQTELTKTNRDVYVEIPDQLKLQFEGFAPGFAWGVPVGLSNYNIKNTYRKIFISSSSIFELESIIEIMNHCDGAVVSGGVTSHMPVFCRSVGKVCIGSIDRQQETTLLKFPYLMIDGISGIIIGSRTHPNLSMM